MADPQNQVQTQTPATHSPQDGGGLPNNVTFTPPDTTANQTPSVPDNVTFTSPTSIPQTRSGKPGKAMIVVPGEGRMMEVDVPEGEEKAMEDASDRGIKNAGATALAVLAPAAVGGAFSEPVISGGAELAEGLLKHLSSPGTILKFPGGRAAEYYLLGKLGLSKAVLKAAATAATSTIPVAQNENNLPVDATHKAPDANGQLHYTNEDGTKDYGVVNA